MDEGPAAPRTEGRACRHDGASALPAGIPAGPAGWRVYPDAVLRLAGEPFDLLAAFHGPRSLHHHALLDPREREAEEALSELTRLLHEAVGAAEPDERRALLAAARNLRRERKFSAAQEAAVRAMDDGGGALARAVDAWRRSERDADEARAALEEVHACEVANSLAALRTAAGGARFRAGVALSSAPFHDRLRAWLARPEAVDRRLERALLRYLTRAAAKTTPFSTFTSLAAARLDPGGGGALLALEDGDEARPAVSVNRTAYALLVPILCETRELHPLFRVSANPSLRRDGDRHSMLLARDGREHAVAFPASDLVDRCVALVRESGGTMPYGALAAALGGAAGAMAAAPGIDRMIAAGILQLDSGIADRETAWLSRLLDLLAPSGHPAAVRVRDLLRGLQEVADAYADADPDGRHALLARARETLAAAVWGPRASHAERMDAGGTPAETAGGWLRARGREPTVGELLETPLYEDTVFARPARVDARRLAPALDALAAWVECVSRATPVWAQRASLRAYHDRAFDGPVPFPVFYERYFADVFEAVLRREREGGGAVEAGDPDAPGAEPLVRARAALDALRRTLAERWAADPAAECLSLFRGDYPGADAPALRPDVPLSAIVFAQLVEAAGAGGCDALVLDKQSAYPGMGKYFSRFLTHFPPEHAAALRAHNGRHPGFLVAELSDDPEFGFSGNLHPPLAEHEISYPARLSGTGAGTGLALVDLWVEPDPTHPWRLRLLHRPSGREVLPVDLGFLTQLRRPPLFRVLSMFSPGFQDGTPVPWRTGAPGDPERRDGGVVRRPRVVFERALVVARASWQVPVDALTGLVAGLPAGAAFRALDRWRRSHGIPRHVFVVAEGAALARRGLRRARGTRKPQYVDLESPLLSELLLETAAAHRGLLVVHEMLPGPESMPRRDGRPYAAELVVQVDRDP